MRRSLPFTDCFCGVLCFPLTREDAIKMNNSTFGSEAMIFRKHLGQTRHGLNHHLRKNICRPVSMIAEVAHPKRSIFRDNWWCCQTFIGFPLISLRYRGAMDFHLVLMCGFLLLYFFFLLISAHNVAYFSPHSHWRVLVVCCSWWKR